MTIDIDSSNNLASMVLDSSPDGYMAMDADWRFVLFNTASERFFSLSRCEVLGRHLWEVFPVAMGGPVETLCREVMRDRLPRDYAGPSILRTDAHMRIRMFPSGDGIAVRFRDVTPEHELEEQHRRALAELESIYRFAPIGLALLDSELRYLKINDALAELDGRAPEDHIGHTIDEVAPGIASKVRPVFQRVFATMKPVIGLELTGETAERGAWLANISPVLVDEGRVRAALVAVMEISAQKRTEEQLAQALKLQKLLQRELVHRVANNFQVVSSMLHLQGRRSDIPGVSDALNIAADRIQAMGIIHRKLYASQPELGTPELVSYLRELCDDLTGIFAGVPDHPELVFKGEGEVRLSIDRSIMLAIVVAELVTNAFKYAYSSGERGHIVVALERIDAVTVRLTVGDQGRGLPDDLDLGASKGLGMLVAHSNARQLGAELEVDRSPPGVRFRITVRTDIT